MPLGLRGRPLVLRGGTRRDLYHTSTTLAITALVRASRAGPSLTVVCIPAALVYRVYLRILPRFCIWPAWSNVMCHMCMCTRDDCDSVCIIC